MTWDEEAREALRAVPGLTAEEDDAILTTHPDSLPLCGCDHKAGDHG